MARYAREAGEVEILKEEVDGGRDGKRLPGRVMLTDRRIVMLLGPKSSGLSMMFGALGMAAASVAAGGTLDSLEMTHEIEREDFASIELERRKMISFHSKGEGYAHISFVVYSRTPFEVWQQRMHQWVAGTLSVASIPTAKVIR